MCWQENKPHCNSVHHETHIANIVVNQCFGSLTCIFKHRIKGRDVWAGWFKAGLSNVVIMSVLECDAYFIFCVSYRCMQSMCYGKEKNQIL